MDARSDIAYYSSSIGRQNIDFKNRPYENGHSHRLTEFSKHKLKRTQTIGRFPKPQINRFTKEFMNNSKTDLLPILVLPKRMVVKCWFYFVRTITLNLYLIHLDTPSIEHDNTRVAAYYNIL